MVLFAKAYYRLPMRVKRVCSHLRLFKLYNLGIRNRYTVAESYGVKFNVDLYTYVGSSLYNLGSYEEETFKFMKESLKLGDVAIDVGASIGAHALRMGAIVGQKGKVYAFEPSRLLFESMRNNIQLNPQLVGVVFPINMGLSDKGGIKSIPMEQLGRLDGGKIDQPIEEACFGTLDDFFLGKKEKLSFIKIDTDGAEPEILMGALKTLKKYKPLIAIEARKQTGEKIHKILSDLGYTLYNEKWVKVTLNDVERLKQVQNLFCRCE